MKKCGIVYSRTVESTGRFDIPEDWLRMPATCHHNNPRLMELAHIFVENPVTRHPNLFYLWGHSYEFDGNNNWNVIEEFAEYIGNREDIWYATNIEVYDYVAAFKNLVFSADGSRVYNPSSRSVWFQTADRLVCVGAGETIECL